MLRRGSGRSMRGLVTLHLQPGSREEGVLAYTSLPSPVFHSAYGVLLPAVCIQDFPVQLSPSGNTSQIHPRKFPMKSSDSEVSTVTSHDLPHPSSTVVAELSLHINPRYHDCFIPLDLRDILRKRYLYFYPSLIFSSAPRF